MYYLDVYNSAPDWIEITDVSASMSTSSVRSVTYNENDGRFYAVGDWGASGIMFYSDSANTAPLMVSNNSYRDMTGFAEGTGNLASIEWNQLYDYGFAVGSGIYKIYAGGNGTVINETTDFGMPRKYNDISWDTDGWTEAAIVGEASTGSIYESHYYRYVPSQNYLSEGYYLGTDPSWTVGFKPPASPKFPMIPMAGGGFKIMVAMQDVSTTITANAVFPRIYWIGFNDTTSASKLEQQVPVDDWYNFTVMANYSQGWSNVEIVVEAWYDWGATGTGSVYPAQTDDNRDLAFKINYTVSSGWYQVLFPTGGLEVMNGTQAYDTDMLDHIDPTQNNHTVQLPIYLGSQIRNATGNGFLSGGTYDQDKNVALNDAWSWDFNITVMDATYNGARDYSHAEFGIDETVSISVSGNPAGNAPPGTSNNSLSNPSMITYSANTDYWVNVSIPNLLINGIGPGFIPATDVTVANVNAIVDSTYTDLNWSTGLGRAIKGPGLEWCVWGNSTGAPTNMPAPSNGTTTFGEFGSNYNAGWVSAGVETTQLDWWVTVQAGTPEGIYWAIITITIES